jgi:hypothetical protein
MSTTPKTVPYGSWQSPITSDLIVTQSIGLSEVRFDGQSVYWLEARPQEQGRNVVVRAGGAGASTTDLVPKPFNVRTRVHEYGGGAWTVALGVLYFSNFADGRLYRLGPGESEPAPLTQRHSRAIAIGNSQMASLTMAVISGSAYGRTSFRPRAAKAVKKPET